jgi:hypothetical protein
MHVYVHSLTLLLDEDLCKLMEMTNATCTYFAEISAYDIYSGSSCKAPLRSVIAPRQNVVTS